MKKINKYLYDNLDQEYERKNLYLSEISNLQEKIETANKNEKVQLQNKLQELVKNKANHEYNKQFVEFKNKEKIFLADLNKESKRVKTNSKISTKGVEGLEARLQKAKKIMNFYEVYISLTYDAKLVYEQCRIEIEQMPSIIKFVKKGKEELDNALNAKSQINDIDEKIFKDKFIDYKLKEKIELKDNIKTLKEKYKHGLISTKAKEESIKVMKIKYKEKILMKSFESKKKFNNEIIKNKKYELTKILKQKINTVNINMEDVRRLYPVEAEKTIPWASYATFLVPGIGQLLNKQYIKSILMFLATIYIYVITIPYALGFGNYQGSGISGLITLAENGGRLDRSINFMIEGILAIILVVIALLLLIASIKDVNKVEREKIKGIRVKSWCETKQTILEEGFPYLVSLPALVIIVFIVFVPIITTVLISFTGMDPNSQAKFGWEALKNYTMIITGEGMAGAVFWKILGWTIIWTIAATTLGIGLGFGLALLLNNERIKGKVIFRSIYLLPWAVPAFITIIFFSILSSPNGALTQMLQQFFGEGFSIKNDAFVSRVVLICIQGWLGSSYVFLLSTGVLQSINKDLYEAADIDGASNVKKLMRITIPMVLFQTAPLLVGQYTFNFNNFSNIYLFNTGGPFNPVEYGNFAGETDILISYIYKLTIDNQYQAIGAAIIVIISIALMIIAYIGFRNTDAFRKEK
ncbi:ABC transporter permease subunit [Clostridium vincentii]|uniref:Maltose transport system permease protein MalF n=1 Tax=Clostridium vincentii TaxID=52704 RepID=A0A2T0BE64_9CLOT|nr:ABC transporter permease subunit [Clostridium vincentii]PRR82165.1 Maltose transport system permease protein MalF [Clostridium vincentii]